eukprot:2014711-Prymnesium_polylepis.1
MCIRDRLYTACPYLRVLWLPLDTVVRRRNGSPLHLVVWRRAAQLRFVRAFPVSCALPPLARKGRLWSFTRFACGRGVRLHLGAWQCGHRFGDRPG